MYMLYAELGITPIEVHIKSRMIGFWIKLVNKDDIKLSKTMYHIMQSEIESNPQYKWLNFIRSILISVGKVDLFNAYNIENPNQLNPKLLNR